MPPFPTLPSMPSLPSLPSFRGLLGTSPPLYYPHSAANDERSTARRSRRDSDRSASGGAVSPSLSHASPRRPGLNRAGTGGYERSRSRSRSSVAPAPVSPAKPHSAPGLRVDNPLGRLLSASASTTDLTGEWEPLAVPPLGAELHRRNSTGAPKTRQPPPAASPSLSLPVPHATLVTPSAASPPSSPARPSHRRAFSAAQVPTLRRPQHPLGRLTEFSRNPLASTSAISLPTLTESEGANDDAASVSSGALSLVETPSELALSPIVRPRDRDRRASRTTLISPVPVPVSPTSLSSSMLASPQMSPMTRNVSELALSMSSDSDRSALQDLPLKSPRPPSTPRIPSFSFSVPPPQTQGLARLRPPSSPRTSTESLSSHRHRRGHSLSVGGRNEGVSEGRGGDTAGRKESFSLVTSPSIPAVSTLSDVAVLATWSFPSPEHQRQARSGHVRGCDAGLGGAEYAGPTAVQGQAHASQRLKERLQALTMLDTAGPSAPSLAPTPASASAPTSRGHQSPTPLKRADTTVHPSRTPGASHRHTHSSPNVNALLAAQGQLMRGALPLPASGHTSSASSASTPPQPQSSTKTTSFPFPACFAFQQAGYRSLSPLPPTLKPSLHPRPPIPSDVSASPFNPVSRSHSLSLSLSRYHSSSSAQSSADSSLPSPTGSCASLPPPPCSYLPAHMRPRAASNTKRATASRTDLEIKRTTSLTTESDLKGRGERVGAWWTWYKGRSGGGEDDCANVMTGGRDQVGTQKETSQWRNDEVDVDVALGVEVEDVSLEEEFIDYDDI